MPCSTQGPRCRKWSPPAAQTRKATRHACMALESSGFSMAGCDVTQARMGVQGRFLDASGSTRQPKYNIFRGATLRRLVARACRQTISVFEPLILLRAPLTNLIKIGRGSDSPHQNWEFGKGIPSPRFGAGIGNARMNHVKIFKGWPPRDAPSKMVKLWYKTFPHDHDGQLRRSPDQFFDHFPRLKT